MGMREKFDEVVKKIENAGMSQDSAERVVVSISRDRLGNEEFKSIVENEYPELLKSGSNAGSDDAN